MSSTFKDKIALITGGGTGIGAAVAMQLAQAGAHVILLGRREAPLRIIASEIEAATQRKCASIFVADAAKSADWQRCIERIQQVHGTLDILIANAGGHGIGTLAQTTDADWQLATQLNLDTAFQATRALMPMLVANGGNVVIVSSLAGHFAGPAAVGYVTMKHALIGLTRALARDYGPSGVRVNAVCPGWVRTAMADEQMQVLVQTGRAKSVDDAYDLVTKHVPLRRAALSEEVATAILFLASKAAAMVTGSYLMVDGGASAVDLPTLAFEGLSDL